jgi:hypothetical protein
MKASNSSIKGSEKVDKTFVSTFLISLSELASMKRIGIGPNSKASLVFNNIISNI